MLREIVQVDDNTLIAILNQIKRLDSFPNVYIAYRIMLTILVRKFFKIKTDKILLEINNVSREIEWIRYIIN